GSFVLPEGAHGITVSGPRAYVTFYDHISKLGGIQTFDVGEPASPPARVGRFETGDSGTVVAISGSYAYVAFVNPYSYVGGIHILDNSDPVHPLRITTYYTLLDPRSILVSGGYAYVADASDGLQIVDVRDPAHPVLAGAWDTPGDSWDVALGGGG